MQINPPTNAAIVHISMVRQSICMWKAAGTGWFVSDHSSSPVCPTESRITG